MGRDGVGGRGQGWRGLGCTRASGGADKPQL